MMFHRCVLWVGLLFFASTLSGVVLGDKPLDSKKLPVALRQRGKGVLIAGCERRD